MAGDFGDRLVCKECSTGPVKLNVNVWQKAVDIGNMAVAKVRRIHHSNATESRQGEAYVNQDFEIDTNAGEVKSMKTRQTTSHTQQIVRV